MEISAENSSDDEVASPTVPKLVTEPYSSESDPERRPRRSPLDDLTLPHRESNIVDVPAATVGAIGMVGPLVCRLFTLCYVYVICVVLLRFSLTPRNHRPCSTPHVVIAVQITRLRNRSSASSTWKPFNTSLPQSQMAAATRFR